MDFYENLTESGVFFFWVFVFLVLVMFTLALVLLIKNRKLKKMIENEGTKNKEVDDTLPISDEPVVAEIVKEEPVKEVVPEKEEEIIKIEEKPKEEIVEIEKVEEKAVEKVEEKVPEKKEEIPQIENKKEEPKLIETSGPYKKNVLREISKKMPISPIHIDRDDEVEEVKDNSVSEEDDIYNLDEIPVMDDSVSPLEKMEDSYEINDNMKAASEIVSKMEEEIKPSNIELTDYEKKQEEEAIISYDELQKVKDKIYNLTEDEEDDEFIDELKNFRLDLE